jgi:predicted PurR-regulated permease PerM
MLSLLGTPLMKLLGRIQIKKRKIPQTVSAAITMVALFALIFAGFNIFIPLLVDQIRVITAIDPTLYTNSMVEWLQKADLWLQEQGIIGADEHVIILFTDKVKSMVDFGYLFGDAVNILSTLFIALFSILFMTFFSLKDNKIFFTMLKKIIPLSYRHNFDSILSATKKQLTRYFTGIVIEILVVGTLEAVICLILGVPNAILIGFLGGILNVIPYVGTIIAMLLGGVFAVTGILPTMPTVEVIGILLLKVAGAFVGAKLLDDFVLQPVIYGKSVQAHPLEIFIVILVAGKLGGIIAMIFAVPAYSLCRIVIKEFFGDYYTDERETELVSKE